MKLMKQKLSIFIIPSIIIIIMLVLSIVVDHRITGAATQTCSDPDGLNYDKQGTTTGIDYNNPSKTKTKTDECVKGRLYEYYCSGSEAKCNGKCVFTMQKDCLGGCSNGACNPVMSCSESDNNKDPKVRGDLKINGVWKQADYCKDSKNAIVTSTPVNSGKLVEFYCEGLTAKSKEYVLGIESEGTKDMKCENGQLLKVVTVPVVQQIGGSSSAGDVVVNLEKPVPAIGSGWGSCINNKGGVTAGKQWVSWQVAGNKDQIEKICKDKRYMGLSPESLLPCQHSNVNQRWNWDGSTAGAGSALVAVKCSSSTRSDNIGCSDVSDVGIDLYKLGSCEGAGTPGTDECVNNNYVKEYYCEAGLCNSVVKQCTKSGYICSNGWCVQDPKGKCAGTQIPCSNFNLKKDKCEKQAGCKVSWTGMALLGPAGTGIGDVICKGTATPCSQRTTLTCGTDETTGCHWVAS